jgi:rare lipoprotein A
MKDSDHKILLQRIEILAGFLILLTLTRCSVRQYPVEGVFRSHQTYYTAGNWYHPQEHYGYSKNGIASWYGPECHGKKKAQGEIYNQYAMTAAHKTLPLPTIVKVTNLENKKSVVVLIDDRGPYKKGRIIDLSASAAKELGMHKKGIAKVHVEALPRESHAFSVYLKKHCGRLGRNTNGKSWEEIYRKNIGSRAGYAKLTPVCWKVRKLNAEEMQQRNTKKQKAPMSICIQAHIQPRQKEAHQKKK